VALAEGTCSLLIHVLLFPFSLFAVRREHVARRGATFDLHSADRSLPRLLRCPATTSAMKHFPPEQKHSILLEYVPHSTTHSFPALATRHGVAGGARTVQRWHERWDGSARSLQRKQGGGRPRALSSRQVQQHVRGPLRHANRAHKSVHYPSVAAGVRQRTGAPVSDRTVRRYGREELEAKHGRGKKRTADESE
jgi:transposase